MESRMRTAHTGSWGWDIRTNRIFWSDESYRIMGIDPEKVDIYRGISYNFMSKEEGRRIEAALAAAVREHKPYDEEFSIRRPDGKTAVVHSWASVQYDAEGNPLMMTGAMQDITGFKLAEERAARHVEFERVVARMARDFINLPLNRLDDSVVEALGLIAKYFNADRSAVWRYDWKKEIAVPIYSWCSLPGSDPWNALLAVPFADVPEIAASHRDGLPFFMKNIDDLPTDSRYRDFVVKYGIDSIHAMPLIANGGVIGSFSIVRIDCQKELFKIEPDIIDVFSQLLADVIVRKDREAALRATNESNRLILESINDGVVLFDRDGIVTDINRKFAQRIGKPVEDIIGLSFKAFLPEDAQAGLWEQSLARFHRVYDTGEPEMFEEARRGLWYSNRLYPVYKDGEVTALTLFSSDITDQKKAGEEARRRAETEARLTVMTEFFTNVSHELKTPLSLILMQIDMMRMHMGDEKRMQKLLDDATLNSYRLTRLVNNLLDITKMDAGFMTLSLRRRDIVDVVKNICDSVAGYASAKSISLEFTSDVPSKHMDADREKLDRVVLNLLSNAIKHTPVGGRISVEIRGRQDEVYILVKDTGEGIPAEKLSSIFDRFVQVRNRMSRQTEGCGIGLALVKSMVELHGGRVWAESEVGKGSLFVVELPVVVSEDKKTPDIIESFELSKKVRMELSDLYIKAGP